MPGSIRLGRLFHIDIYAHVSWFLILALLTWSLATGWFVQSFNGWSGEIYWMTGFLAALLFFACILIHEFAHALVARAHGLRVKNVTLFVFGGVAMIDEEMKRPGVEFKVTAAGPIASFVLAGLAFLLSLPLRGTGTPFEAILDYLVVANVLIGALNLIPGFPLDGGRILRSIIWKVTGSLQRATSIASRVGQICAYFLMGFGLVEIFLGSFVSGLWTIFIGWFLLSAAKNAALQSTLRSTTDGLTVGQVMNRQPVVVPANISVQKLINDYFVPHALTTAPVVQGDNYLVGMISLREIGRLAQHQWACTPVGHIQQPLSQIYTAHPEQPLYEVLEDMTVRALSQIPVVVDGQLVGLLHMEIVNRQLQVQYMLPRQTQQQAWREPQPVV